MKFKIFWKKILKVTNVFYIFSVAISILGYLFFGVVISRYCEAGADIEYIYCNRFFNINFVNNLQIIFIIFNLLSFILVLPLTLNSFLYIVKKYKKNKELDFNKDLNFYVLFMSFLLFISFVFSFLGSLVIIN